MITRMRAEKMRQTESSAVWFEVPAGNVERASTFYTSLFGSKICHVFGRPLVNCIGGCSLQELAARVEALGGEICLAKRAALQLGHFIICRDTEGQMFRLWETSPVQNYRAAMS